MRVKFDPKQDISVADSCNKITMPAAERGYQLLDGTSCDIDPATVTLMKTKTKLYKNDDIDQIDCTPQYSSTEVTIVEQNTIDAAFELQKKGFNPVVLNFANAHMPGGGLRVGGFSQEESICLQSNYIFGLDPTFNPHLAEQLKGPYRIPEFGGIYTPGVTVFRKQGVKGEFMPPQKPLSFIASAAYDWSERGEDRALSEKLYEQGMEKKIRAILKIAADQKHDACVLGAFGCGAFRKDDHTPEIVAILFFKLLRTEFAGVFRKNTFAILNIGSTNNFKVFSDTFGAKGTFDKSEAKIASETRQVLAQAQDKNAAKQSGKESANIAAYFKAIEDGDAKQLDESIKVKGVDVNTPNEHIQTGLHLAFHRLCIEQSQEMITERQQIVTTLLDARASLDATDGNRDTPLHYAAYHGSNQRLTFCFDKLGDRWQTQLNNQHKSPSDLSRVKKTS